MAQKHNYVLISPCIVLTFDNRPGLDLATNPAGVIGCDTALGELVVKSTVVVDEISPLVGFSINPAGVIGCDTALGELVEKSMGSVTAPKLLKVPIDALQYLDHRLENVKTMSMNDFDILVHQCSLELDNVDEAILGTVARRLFCVDDFDSVHIKSEVCAPESLSESKASSLVLLRKLATGLSEDFTLERAERFQSAFVD
jgi:hypothetical protein